MSSQLCILGGSFFSSGKNHSHSKGAFPCAQGLSSQLFMCPKRSHPDLNIFGVGKPAQRGPGLGQSMMLRKHLFIFPLYPQGQPVTAFYSPRCLIAGWEWREGFRNALLPDMPLASRAQGHRETTNTMLIGLSSC